MCPIPDPGSESKNLSILTQKNGLQTLCSGLLIPDLDPDFLPISDPGGQKSTDPRSWIRIRTTAAHSKSEPPVLEVFVSVPA
jgi:hypothetical protein